MTSVITGSIKFGSKQFSLQNQIAFIQCALVVKVLALQKTAVARGSSWHKNKNTRLRYIASRCSEILEEGDIPGNIEEIYELRQWLMVDHFDRQKVNQRLQQYAAGDKEMLFEQEIV